MDIHKWEPFNFEVAYLGYLITVFGCVPKILYDCFVTLSKNLALAVGSFAAPIFRNVLASNCNCCALCCTCTPSAFRIYGYLYQDTPCCFVGRGNTCSWHAVPLRTNYQPVTSFVMVPNCVTGLLQCSANGEQSPGRARAGQHRHGTGQRNPRGDPHFSRTVHAQGAVRWLTWRVSCSPIVGQC